MVAPPPRAGRAPVWSVRRLIGVDQRAAQLPLSIRDREGGKPRSQGTARLNFVSLRRQASDSTTERTAANPSVPRFGGSAAGQQVDDAGLRLPVTVKPVIGNHSSGNDDTDPQHEGKRARDPRCPRRHSIDIPSGDPRKNTRMKDQYVQAREEQQNHFDPEENTLIGPDRYGGEQQRAGNDQDDEARYGPWQQAANDLRYRHLPHGQTEQAQVEHDCRAEK